MKKVIGYIRVSTKNQVREGCSLSYQRDEILKYCKTNNLELVDIYEDAGISGEKVDEDGLTVDIEGLQELLCAINGTNIIHVGVLNTSRIWRKGKPRHRL